MESLCHLASSAQVFELSWLAVFAVTMPRQSVIVARQYKMIHAIKQLLPMPWPEATATRNAS